ncbi:MAG: TetR/AcrR family transcriptional regulator [Candidatus Aminicenantes bacterium]|nr:TetR/AcrR family transcriptional regulator [Candidatus Aminicenantes bacterium]
MPLKVDIDKKKELILTASLEIFSKKGLVKTKMAEIAEAAGIGKGTIYEYYSGKDELFAATFTFHMQQIEEFMNRRLYRVESPLEKLKLYITIWPEFLKDSHLETMDIFLHYWAEGIRTKNESDTFNILKMYEDNRTVLCSLLQECIEQKKIRPVNPHLTASILLGGLDGILIQWILDRELFDLDAAAEALADTFINGLKCEQINDS